MTADGSLSWTLKQNDIEHEDLQTLSTLVAGASGSVCLNIGKQGEKSLQHTEKIILVSILETWWDCWGKWLSLESTQRRWLVWNEETFHIHVGLNDNGLTIKWRHKLFPHPKILAKSHIAQPIFLAKSLQIINAIWTMTTHMFKMSKVKTITT